MKYLIVLTALFFTYSPLFSQSDSTLISGSQPLIYQEVIRTDSTINFNELFIRGRSWFVDAFRNSKEVIQLDDKENGIIIGKGSFSFTSSVLRGSAATSGQIRFTIKLSFKDGRYKYEITDFIHEGNAANRGGPFSFGLITNSKEAPARIREQPMMENWSNKVWNEIKANINRNSNSLIVSLKNYMNQPIQSKNDDW